MPQTTAEKPNDECCERFLSEKLASWLIRCQLRRINLQSPRCWCKQTHSREIKRDTSLTREAEECSQSRAPLPAKPICKLFWPKQLALTFLKRLLMRQTPHSHSTFADWCHWECSMNFSVFLGRMGLKAVASLFAVWFTPLMGSENTIEPSMQQRSKKCFSLLSTFLPFYIKLTNAYKPLTSSVLLPAWMSLEPCHQDPEVMVKGLTLFPAPLLNSAPRKLLNYHKKISSRAWEVPVDLTLSTGTPTANCSPHNQMEDIYSPNPSLARDFETLQASGSSVLSISC